jgi:hypothetical protein
MNLLKFYVHDVLSSEMSTIPSLAHSFFRIVRVFRDIRTVDEVAFRYRTVRLRLTNYIAFEYTHQRLVKRLAFSVILQDKKVSKAVTYAGRRLYMNIPLRPRLEVAKSYQMAHRGDVV